MISYLLDTDTCITWLRGRHVAVSEHFERNPFKFISEITLAELRYGAERSAMPAQHHAQTELLLQKVTLLPISPVIGLFAKRKAHLFAQGIPVADFDLLIGSTALYFDLVLVTNNHKHFSRLDGLQLDNWISAG